MHRARRLPHVAGRLRSLDSKAQVHTGEVSSSPQTHLWCFALGHRGHTRGATSAAPREPHSMSRVKPGSAPIPRCRLAVLAIELAGRRRAAATSGSSSSHRPHRPGARAGIPIRRRRGLAQSGEKNHAGRCVTGGQTRPRFRKHKRGCKGVPFPHTPRPGGRCAASLRHPTNSIWTVASSTVAHTTRGQKQLAQERSARDLAAARNIPESASIPARVCRANWYGRVASSNV